VIPENSPRQSARPDLRSGIIVTAGVIVILPLVLLAVAVYFRSALGDFANDPDYAYLLNGLNVLHGRAPAQIDHPGTTIQILAGVISGFFWLFRVPFIGWLGPEADMLLHPESYLLAIRFVLSALTAAALFALGWRLFRGTGSLIAALAAQVSIFFSMAVLANGLVHAAPEGLMLPLTLAAAMVPAAFASPAPNSLRDGVIVGALLGACLATKTNAIALIPCIFIFRERRVQVAAALSAILAGIFFTLPVAGKYGVIIRYNWDMLAHKGHWDTEGSTLASPSRLVSTIVDMYSSVPEIYIAIALCLALSLLVSLGAVRSEKFNPTRLFLVAAVAMAAEIVLVAKQPQTYYLLPVAAMVCLANGGIMALLMQGGTLRKGIGAVVLVALVAHGWQHGWLGSLKDISVNAAQRRDNNAVQERLAAGDCKIMYAYESQSIPFKLYFGDHFAGDRYTQRMHELYPNAIFYNENGRYLDAPEGIIATAQVDGWIGRQNCVYLVSSPIERFTPVMFGISPDHLTLLDRSQRGMASVAVYRIVPAAPGESIFLKEQRAP
jgi:hypothetical protein